MGDDCMCGSCTFPKYQSEAISERPRSDIYTELCFWRLFCLQKEEMIQSVRNKEFYFFQDPQFKFPFSGSPVQISFFRIPSPHFLSQIPQSTFPFSGFPVHISFLRIPSPYFLSQVPQSIVKSKTHGSSASLVSKSQFRCPNNK